jgi:2-methylcitrate dehydratase PrpD
MLADVTIVDELVERCRRVVSAPLPAPTADVVRRHAFDFLVLAGVGSRTAEYVGTTAALGIRAVSRADLADPRSAAALGVAARMTSADDIHLASCTTPSAIVLPAALCALAAAGSLDSVLLARAVAAGYDVVTALGEAFGGARLQAAGVWPSYALAPVGAAVTVAVASGFDDARLAASITGALALGSTSYSQNVHGGESMRWLGFAGAVAAGIAAARAAEHGLTADAAVADRVVSELLARGGSASLTLPPIDPGVFPATSLRPYSAGRRSLPAVQAFGELMAAESLHPAEIDEIEIGVPDAFVGVLDRPAPYAGRRAAFGAQYQLGLVALHPGDLYDVERHVVRVDDGMARIGAAVRVVGSHALTARYPRRWGTVVRLRAGERSFERVVVAANGDPEHPLDWPALVHKAERMTDLVSGLRAGALDRVSLGRAYDWASRLAKPGEPIFPFSL